MDRKNKYSQYIGWGVTAFAVIAAGVLFYFGIDYMGKLIDALGKLLSILSPFIWGLVISYLLIPSMTLYERKLFKPLVLRINKTKPRLKTGTKLPRVLALILAEIVMLLLITALFYLIVPQVYDSISAIITNSPSYFDSAYSAIDNLLKDYPEIEQYATKIFGNLTDALTKWTTNTLLPSMESVVTNITSGVFYVLKGLYNVVIGIIVSVYILYNKEPFIAHYRKILYSIFSPARAKRIMSALRFADKTFMGFISGKLLDSAIIGVLCYIGCVILKMPYALLIGIIISFTALIPIFGAFIGCVLGGLLIFMVSPKQAILFILVFLILQQIEGNLIYPHVVGSSVGLPSIWVLAAVTIGGNLLGIIGMLIFIPLVSVLYTLFREYVYLRLKRQHIKRVTKTEVEEYTVEEINRMKELYKKEHPEKDN